MEDFEAGSKSVSLKEEREQIQFSERLNLHTMYHQNRQRENSFARFIYFLNREYSFH